MKIVLTRRRDVRWEENYCDDYDQEYKGKKRYNIKEIKMIFQQ